MRDPASLPVPACEGLRAFRTVFQDHQEYTSRPGVAWAPGRVNLIGEHTDYNGGYVLPLAVDCVVAFAGRARADLVVRLWSQHFQELATFSLEGLPESFERERAQLPAWARYVLGVAAELRRVNVNLAGFDAVLQGDVPVGGGMSSSAALEVASVQAFRLFSAGIFNATLTPLQEAELCQRAEWVASGVHCGILDQAASCLGRAGYAVLLNCLTMNYDYLPFDAPGSAIMVIDTSVRRELAASAYNERRQQCEDAVCLLREALVQAEPGGSGGRDLQALCEFSWEEFERYQAVLPALLRQRAGYVIAENRRVLETVSLLRSGDLQGVGELLWQTHAGLRDDYEVSSVELNTLVELARSVPGVLGARMMGGGFGGCTVNLVRDEAIEPLRQLVLEQYPRRTGLQASVDICRAARGPEMVASLSAAEFA